MSLFKEWGEAAARREFEPLGFDSGDPPGRSTAKAEAMPLLADLAGAGATPAVIDEAFAKGLAEGSKRTREELQAVAHQLETTVAELIDFRRESEERFGQELVKVAVAVAEQILRQKLTEQPELWLSMIQAGIRQAAEREQIRIRVSPELYGYLKQEVTRLRTMVDEVKEIELVEDAAAGECGCIVETRYGDVDLSLGDQLEAAKSALLEST